MSEAEEQVPQKSVPIQPPDLKHGIWIIVFSILGGLSALVMLPTGMFLSLKGQAWQLQFLLHLIFILAGSLLSLALLIKLSLLSRWGPYVCIPFGLLFIVAILCASATPIVSRDALIHHLAVPKWWIESDSITPIRWHEWSFYPMLINLGFAGLLSHGLEMFAPHYHFCYLLLLCGVTSWFCYYKTREAELAYLAFLLTLTLPICQRLASSPLVDLGLALYTAIALCSVILWSEKDQKFRYVFLAGMALGLAAGCKYNGFLAAGLISLLFLVLSARSKISFTKSLVALVFCGIFALAVAMPWLVKNIIWTGSNPVYPMFQGTLGSQGATAIKTPSVKPLEKLIGLYGNNISDIILMPLKMILVGQDHDPFLYDGRLSPILFLCIFPLFFIRSKPWVVFFYFYLVAYFYFSITLSSARVRYMMPLLFPVIILTLSGLQQLGSFFNGRFRYQLYTVLGSLHLLFALHYSYNLLGSKKVFPYLSGDLSREEYLTASIPEYPLIQYLNTETPADAQVYLLFTGNQFYYYDRMVRSGGYHSAQEVIHWVKTSDDAETLASQFLYKGIQYLLIREDLLQRSFGGDDNLTKEQKLLWNSFHNTHLKLATRSGRYSLWEIQPAEEVEEEPPDEWTTES